MSFNFLKNAIEESFMPKSELIYSTTGDGRLDSAESEAAVLAHLHNLFDNSEVTVTDAPRPRYWYDVILEHNGKKHYANIKVTSGAEADNVSSKNGIFYALTGILPDDIQGINTWAGYNKKLMENLSYDTEADYYFIIYFKEDESFLVTSLKRINILTPNGSNLPFQCKWSDNDVFTTRSSEAQITYIMDTYYDSWLKKVSGFAPLMAWKENEE